MSCDTPDNTGKIPDQKPQRLKNKLRACPETRAVRLIERIFDDARRKGR